MTTPSVASFRRRVAIAVMIVLGSAAVFSAAQPPGAGQTEFVPLSELPPEDQLPAAPLLIAAYAFVWVALLGYLWSIWRRLGRVESELKALARQTAQKRP